MHTGCRPAALSTLALAGLLLAGCAIENSGLRDRYTGQSLLQPDKLPRRVARDAHGDPVPWSVDGTAGTFAYRPYHHRQE